MDSFIGLKQLFIQTLIVQVKIIRFDAISQDITSKQVIESQQNLLIKQSKHSAMGEMISMITHQWRQPLQAVSILVQKIPLTKMMGNKSIDFRIFIKS